MKIARYLVQGKDRIGVSTGGDFGLLAPEFSSITAALAPESRATIEQAAKSGTLEPAGAAQLQIPLDAGARIFCIGVNYRSHVAETHREVEPQPSVFIRTQASIVAHGAGMVRPTISDNFDYEGELTVVIGRRGRLISQADALAHVAGYTCFNDGSIRDFQKHSTTSGKNFEASGACGPWIVASDELPDPTTLTLVTRLNGVEVQRSTTDLLIHSIPRIIEYISIITTLEPGDTIEVDISGIGVLSNPIVQGA